MILILIGSVTDAGGLPDIPADKLKVGSSYSVLGVAWGKVLEVIDDDDMVLGIDNGAAKGKARYRTVVWCKGFKAAGKADDQTGYLHLLLGANQVKVTGTAKWKAPGGATKTVFVLESAGK